MKQWRRYAIWLLAAVSLSLFLSCGTNVPTEAIETRELCLAYGGAVPTAADFLTDEARELCAERGIEVAFAEEPDLLTLGERTVVLSVGGETIKTRVCVVEDNEPPVLIGVKDASCLVGTGVVLRQGISVEDNCFGAIEWTVDASAVDTSRVGMYTVVYRATDARGNVTERTALVTVYAEEITEDMLYAACDEYLAALLPDGADRETICRRIWAGVQTSIAYHPISDKTSPVRAAYLALFRDGRGDCYSYFAAARALLERAGIEYLEIERTRGAREDTHYWLMVNLAGEGETPRWYHFDPTELDTGGYPHDGCLFTDAELDAYNAYNVGFYDYDRAAYPATANESLR